MNDFERQLREAMREAVADAQPPPSVMESVRRRCRRRSIWLAAASVLALAIVIAAVPVASALQGGGGRPAYGRTPAAPLFPGGGRLLLDRHGVLEWLYPDGRTVRVASGFAGATLAGRKLLAWKHANPPGASRFLPHGCFDPDCTRIHDLSYYTMNLDGSDTRLILPAESPAGNIAFQYEDAQLSPDGGRLAYISQQIRNGTKNIFLGATELWSLDLKTGQKTDLGPYSANTVFAWKDSATILAGTAERLQAGLAGQQVSVLRRPGRLESRRLGPRSIAGRPQPAGRQLGPTRRNPAGEGPCAGVRTRSLPVDLADNEVGPERGIPAGGSVEPNLRLGADDVCGSGAQSTAVPGADHPDQLECLGC